MKKLLLITLMIAITTTCFSQKGKWEKAQKTNTIESYKEFLKENPNSEFSDEAKLELINLEFKRAQSIDTKAAFKYFLEVYGENDFTKQATNKLTEFEFENVCRLNSKQEYETFLKLYPNDIHISDIKERLLRLTYKDYNVANVEIGTNVFDKVVIKDIVVIRLDKSKSLYQNGIPDLNPNNNNWNVADEKLKIKNDTTNNAYKISYYLINGKHIKSIINKEISIIPNEVVYKFDVINTNPVLNDSDILTPIFKHWYKTFTMRLQNCVFPWFGFNQYGGLEMCIQCGNETISEVPNVGVLIYSCHYADKLSGGIIGYSPSGSEQFKLRTVIQVVTSENSLQDISID